METKERLKNGATVLERKNDIVLALYNNEFVVWTVTEDNSAYWGHYFDNVIDAVKCFKSKTGE